MTQFTTYSKVTDRWAVSYVRVLFLYIAITCSKQLTITFVCFFEVKLHKGLLIKENLKFGLHFLKDKLKRDLLNAASQPGQNPLQRSEDDLPSETLSQYDAELGEPDTAAVDTTNNDTNLDVEIQPDPVDFIMETSTIRCNWKLERF